MIPFCLFTIVIFRIANDWIEMIYALVLENINITKIIKIIYMSAISVLLLHYN